MDLLVPIGVNVLLGLLLLAVFALLRPNRPARLSGPEEALMLFRGQFPDAEGTATVSAEGLIALIAMRPEPGIGLLHHRGRRWNARALHARDLRTVRTVGDTVVLTFADFGWPRIHFRLTDAEARRLWLARLDSLAGRGAPASSAEAHHA